MLGILSSTNHFIGIAIDAVVVILLLTFACIGYHKGFFKSLLALFSTTVVIIASVYFANGFAKIINSIFDFTSMLAKTLAPSIENLGSVYGMTFPTGLSGTQFYNSYIDTSSTNSILKKFFKFALKGYSSEDLAGLKVADVLAGSISSIIITIVAGIILFILIKIALSFLSRFFDNITRIKVLGGLNKIMGFVFGAAKGAALILVFIVITICVSFVPKLNKKLYPLIQNDTHVVKFAYNTTEKVVEKYFVKSDLISKWINNLWDNRNLTPEKKETIADKATTLDTGSFTESGEIYTANFENLNITNEVSYFRLNSFIAEKETATITITLTYTSADDIDTAMYYMSNLDSKLSKKDTSSTTTIIYENVTYEDYIISLKSLGENMVVGMEITII